MSKKYFYSYFIILAILSYFLSTVYSNNISSNNFTWPTENYKSITSYFGSRIHPTTFKESFHLGIDISVPEGIPLQSICSGVVSFTGFNGAYGYSIIIKNSNYEILYGHVSPNYIVSIGDTVLQNSIIGNIGPKYVSNSPYKDSSRKIYKWKNNWSTSSFGYKKRRHSRQSFRLFLIL